MRIINTPGDFEAALKAERAMLLVYFSWSARAAEAQQALALWERELAAQGERPDWTIFQLTPDEHFFTWKWVGEHAANTDSPESVPGSILWLRAGSVVGRTSAMTKPGSKELSRLTGEFLGVESLFKPETACAAELVKLLCCPETRQGLALASASMVRDLNQRIAAGGLQSRNGKLVREKLEGGLVRSDGKWLYPVRQSIPTMLVDEAIALG